MRVPPIRKVLTRSRSEHNPPWTQACVWNDLLRQWLTTNKGLPGYCRLTRLNTLSHANDPTASHYFSMHIARLLCQLFLHWEFLPFLPLRFKQAEGVPSSHSLYRQVHEAPPGFWKSSARECFGAARSILTLAADAREARSLTTSPFALYGIFVAKFIEVYARAFPWMNPDCTATEERSRTNANSAEHASTCLSCRPLLSYDAEIEDAHVVVPIAEQWVSTLDSITIYFEAFKHDFARSVAFGCSRGQGIEGCNGQDNICLRDGGSGEGCEEYELFRHRLCHFGRPGQ